MKTYNQTDLGEIRFVVYIRKSSEGDERQALSPENQRKVIEQITERYDIKPKQISMTFSEAHSAKTPGQRPMFNKLLQGIGEGLYDGILTWQPSRMSRNPMDAGSLVNLMDTGKLKVIITAEKLYEHSIPMDKFWFGFQCMEAKLENDNRGISSKGGMATKANMGWMPSSAPLGYKNTPDLKKGFKTIIKDEERFELVKRLFNEVIKGKQASQVYIEASTVWKLTNQHGKIISRSTVYNILTKPFYYGEYEYPKGSGIWIKGQHEPMITKEEFDLVQKALGRFGKPVAHSHTFDLTGLFRCNECGSAITATTKTKYYKKTDRFATYVYYHCTKKNKKIKCHSKALTESDIFNQINNILVKISPDQDFVEWSNRWLAVVHKDESNFKVETLKSQQIELTNIEKRLSSLLDLKIDGVVDNETYTNKKQILEQEKAKILAKLANTSDDLDDWRKRVENTIEFARVSQYKFQNGTREDKQVILLTIGSNLLLNNNKVLDVTLKNEYGILANKENWATEYKGWLEPQKYTEIMAKYDDLRPANPVWLPLKDLFCNNKLEFEYDLNQTMTFYKQLVFDTKIVPIV